MHLYYINYFTRLHISQVYKISFQQMRMKTEGDQARQIKTQVKSRK